MRQVPRLSSKANHAFRMLVRSGQAGEMQDAFERLLGRLPYLDELVIFVALNAGKGALKVDKDSLHLWQQLAIGVAVLEADRYTKH
jgi:hypothetical protein